MEAQNDSSRPVSEVQPEKVSTLLPLKKIVEHRILFVLPLGLLCCGILLLGVALVKTRGFSAGRAVATTAKATTIGLYDPIGEIFYLKKNNVGGNADRQTGFIPTTKDFLPIAGDWTGSGTSEYGLYDPETSFFHLHYDHSHPTADLVFHFGLGHAGWLPIAGDWTGSGKWGVGLYNPTEGKFYLIYTNTAHATDNTFSFGPTNSSFLPIAGDWNGDGKTTIGLYDRSTSTFYLRDTNTSGYANYTFQFGAPNTNWLPIAGDWTGSGKWGVGLYNPTTSVFYLKNSLSAGSTDFQFQFGPIGRHWSPFAGSFMINPPPAVDLLGPLHGILITGQSLAVGAAGSPALTLTQPYNNLGLNDGQFVPLIESTAIGDTDGAETIASSMANSISYLVSPTIYQLFVTNNGQPRLGYADMKKGTAPYAQQLSFVTNAKALADKVGDPYTVEGLIAINGETDSIYYDPTIFANDLYQWYTDYNADVKQITGQTNSFPLFTDQMSGFTALNEATPTSALAQLLASEEYPGKIILVGPKYFLTYNGNAPVNYVHPINSGYQELGEYYAKVYKKVVIDGQSWTPLSPKTISLSGKIITAVFNVPVLPLQIDTNLVRVQSNYGFEYADDGPNTPTITNVAITAQDTIQITLSATPTGTNPRLRYAYTGVPGSIPGANQPGSARGNIHDNDTTQGFYDHLPLYNWLVHFDKPITVLGSGTGVSK